MTTGPNYKALKEAAGLSARQLAEGCHLAMSSVFDCLRRNKRPRNKLSAERWDTLLGVSTKESLAGVEDRAREEIVSRIRTFLVEVGGRALGVEIAEALGVESRSLRPILEGRPDFTFTHQTVTRSKGRSREALVVIYTGAKI